MENKKKRRGMLALLLGLALTVCGGALLLLSGGRMEYILPAPTATQEGGELNALYEDAQKQLASIADSVTASAVGARAQGINLTAEAQSAETTVYAVGSGYFDVVHETLLDGRLISEADVKRAENVNIRLFCDIFCQLKHSFHDLLSVLFAVEYREIVGG